MKTERKGEAFSLLNSLLEGLFPVLSIAPVALIGPLYTYGSVLAVAAAVLVLILVKRRELHVLLQRDAQKDLVLTALLNTTMFCLVFFSLKYTTAGNVAVLMFMQLLFSYLYFHVLGKERLTRLHTAGALAMGVGALVILVPDEMRFNPGDLLALGGGALAPLVNFVQKRARKRVNTIVILAYRNLAAIPVLFLLAWLVSPPLQAARLMEALPNLLAVGLLVYVLAKICWVEALHRISITKISAMNALVPISTLLFAYVFLREVPGIRALMGIVPVLVGGVLITRPRP